MSDHSIEYHRTWAKFFALVVALGFVLLVEAGITTHTSHLAEVKYRNAQIVACVQSDRPAADCRLIVFGAH